MTEPHSTAAAAQAAASSITAMTLALVGVPHLALVWGFAGAVIMLVLTGPESRAGALLAVLASGLVGAAGGAAGGTPPAQLPFTSSSLKRPRGV